jgi:hypothetical protein
VNCGTRVPGTDQETAYGGFGGGAANHGNCGEPQGGGGYSGGSSYSSGDANGGGGGSYFEGSFGSVDGRALAGHEQMPDPSLDSLTPSMLGNSGDGAVLLSLMAPSPGPYSCVCFDAHQKQRSSRFLLIFLNFMLIPNSSSTFSHSTKLVEAARPRHRGGSIAINWAI